MPSDDTEACIFLPAEGNTFLLSGNRGRWLKSCTKNLVKEKAGKEFEGYAETLYQTMFNVSKSYQSELMAMKTLLSPEITAGVQNSYTGMCISGRVDDNAIRAVRISGLYALYQRALRTKHQYAWNTGKNYLWR